MLINRALFSQNSGQVSRAQAEECAKHGLVVKADADWGPEMLEGRRGSLGPADLRQAILHIVTGGQAARCPSWLWLVVRSDGFAGPIP